MGALVSTKEDRHRVTLPVLPPSTNHLYRQVPMPGARFGVRAKDPRYKDFLKVAVPYLRGTLPALRSPVALRVVIWGGKGWIRSADVSNRIKAVEDALVKAGRIEDDSCLHVRAVSSCYRTREEHCRVRGEKPTKAAQGRVEAVCVLEVRELGRWG